MSCISPLKKYSLVQFIVGTVVTCLLLSILSVVGQAAMPPTKTISSKDINSASEPALLSQNNPNLQVVTDLTFSSATPISGEAVTGTFAIKNVGSEPFQLANLLISGRGDGCVDWSCTDYQSFTSLEDITISPGDTVRYSQQKTFTATGNYFAQIAYQLSNGSWGFLESRVEFTVAAQLVLDAPLTFDPNSPVTGEPTAANFTVRNAGTEPVEFFSIGVGVRGPDCADWANCTVSGDMPYDTGILLEPGKTFTFTQQKVYWDVSSYLARIAIKTVDGWSFLGEETIFAVAAGLVVTTPLSITPDAVHTNEFVTASFTVQNQSGNVLTYSRLGVAGRGPNCQLLDWSCDSDAEISFVDSVTINPGEFWQYSERHFLPESGDYFFQIWVKQTNGVWQRLGTPLSMTVAPRNYPARSQALKVGAHAHLTLDLADDTQLLTKARDMGIDIVRITLLWRFLEKDFKGDWDDNWYIPAVRQTLEKANELGLEVYISFYEAPCWASSDPNKECGNDSGGTYDDAYPAQNHQDYADAYQKVVEEFGSRVTTWEVWNEPNIERFWHPSQSIADYTEMLRVVYPVIKRADPNATVLAGVIAGSNVPVLEEMYAAGAKGNFDALSIHPYSAAPTECTNPDWSFLCGVEIVRATMLKHNDPKPIWFSEFGWSSYTGTNGHGVTTQRDYLVESIDILGNWDYVSVATWYSLRDRTIDLPQAPFEKHFGLLDANLRDKPAATWLRNRPKLDAHLAISTPFSISSNSSAETSAMTASFSIQNSDSQPVRLNKIGVIMRDVACAPHLICASYQDFPLDQNVTIDAGETYRYNRQLSATQSGEHFAQIVYESTIGEWFVMGNRSTVSIGPGFSVTAMPAKTSTPIPNSTPTPVPNVTPTPTVSSGTITAPPRTRPLLDLYLPMLVK